MRNVLYCNAANGDDAHARTPSVRALAKALRSLDELVLVCLFHAQLQTHQSATSCAALASMTRNLRCYDHARCAYKLEA